MDKAPCQGPDNRPRLAEAADEARPRTDETGRDARPESFPPNIVNCHNPSQRCRSSIAFTLSASSAQDRD